MDKLLFAVMAAIIIYVTVKNFSLFRRYKHNKEYIECYQDVLHNKDNCYERIQKYIESEKEDEYRNKARVIQLYYELSNDIDNPELLNSIDLRSVFYSKGKYEKNLVNLNSDVFIFIMLVMAKAYDKGRNDIIDAFVEKVNSISELSFRLEYQEIIAFANALEKKEDCGNAFMHSLLDGNYTDYVYEKNLIGLYKRVASSTLAFNNEEFEGFFKSDLHSFSKSLIGESLLKSLKLYEAYKPVDEQVEVEENKENQE